MCQEPWINLFYKKLTLNSCTPITANMNSSRHVTNMMLPMVLMATMTHCTTRCEDKKRFGEIIPEYTKIKYILKIDGICLIDEICFKPFVDTSPYFAITWSQKGT